MGKIHLEVGGVTDCALRLNWQSEEVCSGYIVEQRLGKEWKKVVWIGDGNITTCRIEDLNPFTVYRFRIIPFIYDSCYREILGRSVEIEGKTAPPNIFDINVKQSLDSIILSWQWNKNAQGCILEKKEKNVWKRIARIADRKICSFQIQNLRSGKKYEMRIKTFAFWGKKPTYSSYKYLVLEKEDGASVRKKGEGK